MSSVPEVWDLTSVADDEVVFHLHSPDPITSVGEPGDWSGPGYEVITGIRPGASLLRHGIETRTLERPRASCFAASPPSTTFISARPSAATSPDISEAVGYLAAAGSDVDVAKDSLRAFLEELGPLVVNSVPGRGHPLPGDDEPRRRYRDRRL